MQSSHVELAPTLTASVCRSHDDSGRPAAAPGRPDDVAVQPEVRLGRSAPAPVLAHGPRHQRTGPPSLKVYVCSQ